MECERETDHSIGEKKEIEDVKLIPFQESREGKGEKDDSFAEEKKKKITSENVLFFWLVRSL